MNRFRTKKSRKDISDGVTRPSTDSDAPTVSNLKPSKTFRLGKKHVEPESKPHLDLSTVLPPSDDFRTSLLMSGLSARFSMLREQDDPKSKIGKASDDSVLFPKRKSRLDIEYGLQSHGLSDIAEVSSVHDASRPAFSDALRLDSFRTASSGFVPDHTAEHTGSIMNRSKPGEGNNLFGGRQKVQVGNRTLYESDVSESAYQKLRREEREKAHRQLDAETHETHEVASNVLPRANKIDSRETSSPRVAPDASSHGRVLTAATSFTSSPPSVAPITSSAGHVFVPGGLERSVTKTRRLYETGLNDYLHEQQSSAMSRLDTLTRQRTLGTHTPPPGPSPTFPSTSQSEKWGTSILSKQSMPNLRGASPPTAGTVLGPFDFGGKNTGNNANIDLKPFVMTAPPLSPPISEYGEVPVPNEPVQFQDRSREASAEAFSKSKSNLSDDGNNSQRQIRPQQGRETPPLAKNSPPRVFQVPPPQQSARDRAESNSTYGTGRSRSSSSVQRIRLPDRIAEFPPPTFGTSMFTSASHDSSPHSTVDSDLKVKPLELSNIRPLGMNIKLERPPESEHPMNRPKPFDQDPHGEVGSFSHALPNPSLQSSPAKSNSFVDASVSRPPHSAMGLSGMVRQHLRSDSNSSSIYGGAFSTTYDTRYRLDPSEGLPGLPSGNDYSLKSNPWDHEWDDSYYSESHHHDEAAHALNGDMDVSPSLSVKSPDDDTSTDLPRKESWEIEVQISKAHNRDGSNATQKEQQDFKNELASRRRRVQENLKSFHENDSASTSPLTTPDLPKEGSSLKSNALGLLKKPSRGSLMVRTNTLGQSKALKMLGLGSSSAGNGPVSPGLKATTFLDDSDAKVEEEVVNEVPRPTTPPGTRAFRQARREMQRNKERQLALKHQKKMESAAGESDGPASGVEEQYQGQQIGDRAIPSSRTRRRTPSRDRKPPPVTYKQRNPRGSQESKYSTATDRSDSQPPSSRDRSESDTSGGRSKSRNGRYKDDLAKAMADGFSSSSQPGMSEYDHGATRYLPRSPSTPQLHQSPMPSPRMHPANRSRSNSRSAAATTSDGHAISGLQTSLYIEPGMPSRPSPSAPFVVNPTPPLVQPTGSGSSTPTTSQAARRKFSVNKSDISDPVFLSSTSRVDTVNLPPGASLKNGIYAPPIPPVNPRRLQARGVFGLNKRSDSSDELSSLPAATQSSEEMSTFSADEDEGISKSLRRLKKSSSEGGNLNARARQAAYGQPSPAMPGAYPGSGLPMQAGQEGAMF